MELALVARDPEYWLRDSWSVVKLTSGWMMPSASRAIIPLGKLSLQSGMEFRADKFVKTTYKDLRFIALLEWRAGSQASRWSAHKTRRRSRTGDWRMLRADG